MKKIKHRTIDDLLEALQNSKTIPEDKIHYPSSRKTVEIKKSKAAFLRFKIEEYGIVLLPIISITNIIKANAEGLKGGSRIPGIKSLKEHTALGLKECKEIMDNFNNHFKLKSKSK